MDETDLRAIMTMFWFQRLVTLLLLLLLLSMVMQRH